MQIKLNSSRWKRFFSVPCALVDEYLKLADAAAIKLLLYLMCDEAENLNKDTICKKAGITSDAFDDAVIFWQQQGVILAEDKEILPPVQSISNDNSGSPEAKKADNSQVKQVLHAKFTPKDITSMIETNDRLKELFFEAEQTLGRILKHCDHEMLINLVDYYGFSVQSVVLILEYCRSCEKTSARYIESVASDFFEKGMLDFLDIDSEINRRKVYYAFENRVRREFGIDTKLTSKQSQYISTWQDLGFEVDMIGIAREKCVDATNKLSFAYIDKILHSWADKKIFKPEDIELSNKPSPAASKDNEHSFDLDEFEQFTLQNKPQL